jgi:hypothetical protein
VLIRIASVRTREPNWWKHYASTRRITGKIVYINWHVAYVRDCNC